MSRRSPAQSLLSIPTHFSPHVSPTGTENHIFPMAHPKNIIENKKRRHCHSCMDFEKVLTKSPKSEAQRQILPQVLMIPGHQYPEG